jgi:hypothetical protein
MYAELYLDQYHPHHTLFIKIKKILINHKTYSVKVVHKLPRINNIKEDLELKILAYIRLKPRSLISLLKSIFNK